jgi:putative Ca2+/H+ antiporter (TMEM165/GDT1 family)
MDLLVVALTFATIFLVELPDKTFIATLVLSTRFRPLLVWVGVGLAFAAQTAIAVGLGSALSLLPITWVRIGAAVLFLVGAILLFREARNADAEEAETEEEFAERADKISTGSITGSHGRVTGGWKAVLASFLVLFAAEWGDLSQLLTLSLVAKYDAPSSVYVGALGALLAVSGLAVVLGRILLSRIRLSTLHYVGGSMCLVLEAITLYEILG